MTEDRARTAAALAAAKRLAADWIEEASEDGFTTHEAAGIAALAFALLAGFATHGLPAAKAAAVGDTLLGLARCAFADFTAAPAATTDPP